MENTKSKKSSMNAIKVDKSESNSEIITRTEVKNSPFVIISTEGQHFGTMGKYRITDYRDSVEVVKEDLEQITWNRLIQVMQLLIENQK